MTQVDLKQPSITKEMLSADTAGSVAESVCTSVVNLVCGSMHASAFIMAYGSMPYVGMTPKKNGGHNESAQMTCSKCLR